MVPEEHLQAVQAALRERLAATKIGHPALTNTQMGALVSLDQRADVWEQAGVISAECNLVFGSEEDCVVEGADPELGAFLAPMLFCCPDPDAAVVVHQVEAFGPVATLMPYRDIDHAVALLNRGGGSLVASVFTHD